MLLVKTKIGTSEIHGIGLFADEFIPKHTPTWEFTPGFDVILGEEEVSKLPPLARQAFLYYCYKDLDLNKYILPSDNGRFMNHSDDPTTGYILSISEWDIALRDIQHGEELTYNCKELDGDWERKMSQK